MKKFFFVIILFFSINSCTSSRHEVNFEIKNNTYDPIFNLNISNGFNQYKIDTVMPKTKNSIILKFKNVPKHDGGYSLNYVSKSLKTHKNFGYYSNGVPFGSMYSIEILKDTLIIKETFK